jgi:translocation and assembly module TamB
MATAAGPAPHVPRGHLRARRAAKWTGLSVLAVIVLFGLFLIWLNSSLGHRYVVRQINNMEMASGLDIDVGRIEGSLFGQLKIHDLQLKDPKGLFFVAPEATVDWRPLSYFRNRIDIKRLEIPRARLFRLPQFNPGDPNAPLLPNIDMDIGRLEIGRMLVDAPVTGYRHILTMSGGARIDKGRGQLALDVGAIAARGLPGGDKLTLRLDAVPEENRLAMGVRIEAPGDGFVAKLAGIDKPLVATLGGRGTWAQWRGRARAVLGGQEFANLAVEAKDGTFGLTGPVRPGMLMAPGLARNLLSPLVQVNATAKMDGRRADTKLRLNSRAMTVVADGIVDLGRNQLQDFRAAIRLPDARVLGPNIGGDVRLATVMNGAFATPFVAYELSSRALSVNDMTIEMLQARGRAKVDSDRIRIPVQARARRISGLDPSLGGLLTNVAVNGTLNISGTRLVSDDLKVRSDRLNATVVLAADLARGQYRAGINGTVNNFHMEGIGLLDLTTNMDVVTAGAGFGLKGRIAVRTRRIDNATAAGLLEGNATAAADVTMNPAGLITLANVRLSSPGLRITSGSGTIWPDGRINIRAAGVSRAYGPIAVVVTGSSARPNIQLRAASPGFGFGLRDVTATVRSTAAGYAIVARGQSDYGPFEADVTILSGRGPMTIDIRRLTFAGMTFAGRVQQTRAGPFAGTLTMIGEGMHGTVVLAAAGRYQRADINAVADGATIPGESPILIQRGLVQATVILYPDAPHIVGDVQLAGVRSRNFFLARARAKADYRGGSGLAQVFAEGSSGVPFRVGINAALSPDLIRAAAQGQVNRIPFRLARPAEIRRIAGGWQLSPTQLVLPQGNVLLAGRTGSAGTVIQSRLKDFDISVLNAFSPGLGLGGRATGSIDFAQLARDSFPRADARLTIAGFTRTGIAVRSPAVDLTFAGQLRPEGGSAAAVIRRGGAVIGRAQARLQPVGPGAGGWIQRLLAAPLAGGIRYNGPAEVLWSFTGIADQQLSGPIGVAADFSGRVQQPQLAGIVRANSLTFTDETYGTRITNLALQGRFTSSELEITRLAGRAGRGTIEGTGRVGFASAAGYPMDIRLNLNEAQLARSDNLGATLTGQLAITNDRRNGALIAGDLRLPELRYQIIRQGAAQVVELAGVRRKGQPLPTVNEAVQTADAAPSIWKLDLRVRADNQVFIAGMGLESEWSADLRIQGTTSTPSLIGEADLIRGTYSFSGQRFDVTRGHIAFTGARPPNPRIDLVASADIKDVTVNINVSGSANNPQIAFTSNPGLPQDEIMARILFGGSVTEISALQAVQLASSLNSLRGGGGGLNPLGKLRSAGGFDRLRILGADETTGRGTAIAAGFYVSNDVYLEIITDARGFTATQIEIALSKALSLLSQFATSGGGNNVNLRYRKQY